MFVAFQKHPFDRMLETWPNFALLPIAMIGAFFGIGVTLLWFGMMWACATTSEIPICSKGLWLLLLLPTSGVGALIYYFCEYKNRPSGNPFAQDKQTPA